MEKDKQLLPYRFRGKVFYNQADVDASLDAHKADAAIYDVMTQPY